MEHHEAQRQKDLIPPQGESLREAPSSLLSGVLRRLDQRERYLAQRSNQALLDALEHPQWEIRAAAVRALAESDLRAPLEPLIAALQDEHRLVRAAAVRASGRLTVRVAEASTLVEHMCLALRDGEWEVREIAVLALGELSSYTVEPLLQGALQDSNSHVREAAHYALVRHAETRAQAHAEIQRRSFGLASVVQAPMRVKHYLLHFWLVFSRQFSLLNRNIWLVTVLAMIVACVLAFVMHANAQWVITVATLSASAVGAAHIYGAENDTGVEIALSTPTSIRAILLARLATMLSYNIVLATLTSAVIVLVYGGGLWTLIHLWLEPALLLSSFSLALSLLLGSMFASLATLLFEISQVLQFGKPFFVIQLVDLNTCVWQLHPVLLSMIALGCLALVVLYAPRYSRLAHP